MTEARQKQSLSAAHRWDTFRSMRLVLLMLCLLFPLCANAATLHGKVIKVVDGDTIDILHNDRSVRLRLNGIDAPERGQAFGNKARQFVLLLAAQQAVVVEVMGEDHYHRSIGEVTLPDGRNLSREIVKAGFAWWYRTYSSDTELGKLESEAKRARRGLWHDLAPQAPWEWRALKRGERLPGLAMAAVATGPFRGNVKSNVFHRATCEHFSCKNCRAGFNRREEALSAGYKPCGECRP